MTRLEPTVDETLTKAVAAATDTRRVWLGQGIRESLGALFRELLPDSEAAVVVADETTYEVAGRAAERALRAAGLTVRRAHVFPDRPAGRRLHADYEQAQWLRDGLAAHGATPIAVGSGTINDLTKLAAHLAERPYLVVATAASMDGYAAFGAAITQAGYKQTVACPAPRGVVGDIEILAAAPVAMTASGFGDLAGKIPAGADWLLADAVGAEPVDPLAWELVQPAARDAMEQAAELGRGDAQAVARLFRCLVMSGLAMQAARSSRPASGAEHQLSHLWEMRGLTHNGEEPSHGFKVGVGSVLIATLYERLLAHDWGALDDGAIEATCRAWPPLAEQEEELCRTHHDASVRERALAELRAKYLAPDELRGRLACLRDRWPALRPRLVAQLLPAAEVARRLRAVGCPSEPQEIGLSAAEAVAALEAARHIRRRYTVLDLAAETGLLATHASLAA